MSDKPITEKTYIILKSRKLLIVLVSFSRHLEHLWKGSSNLDVAQLSDRKFSYRLSVEPRKVSC